MSLNIWVPGGLLGTMLSLPSKRAADTWQMGNYAARDPCLLLSFSCGKEAQKLVLKWFPGEGRLTESVLGLCSSKLTCAGGGKWEAQAFCAGLSARIGRCLRDADGSEGQPAMTSLCKDRVGSAAGAAPVVSRMTLPAA